MNYRQLRLLTIFWITAIIVGSLSPVEVKRAIGTETESNSRVVQTRVEKFHLLMHAFTFGVGGLLLAAVSLTPRRRMMNCLALFVLGCALELLQYYVGSEVLETGDICADGVGIVTGLIVVRLSGFGSRARREMLERA